MNIMLMNPSKNYDKVTRELRKDKPQESTIVKELRKAYTKEAANGILAGVIIGLATFGAMTIINNFRADNEEN